MRREVGNERPCVFERRTRQEGVGGGGSGTGLVYGGAEQTYSRDRVKLCGAVAHDQLSHSHKTELNWSGRGPR